MPMSSDRREPLETARWLTKLSNELSNEIQPEQRRETLVARHRVPVLRWVRSPGLIRPAIIAARAIATAGRGRRERLPLRAASGPLETAASVKERYAP
jgi:hypothetical protein